MSTTPASSEGSKPIPQPKESWLLGNVKEIDTELPIGSFRRLAKLYGPIYQLNLVGRTNIFVGTQALSHALSDENVFEKEVSGPLEQVRTFAGDGLFTAYNTEPTWSLAHRILIPAFNPLAIKRMQPAMTDVVCQLLLHWDHHAGQVFEATDQYTKLTLDTIALTAFNYRFNSFHSKEMHPFVDKMVKLLKAAGPRGRRPELLNKLMWSSEAEFQADTKFLHQLCDDIVLERKRHPDPEANDLLNCMLLDRDPKTGEGLSDENIRYQMVTFLIAGHETTSGMLSFATYYILKNPAAMRKAREEADRVIGEEAQGNYANINIGKLKYIDACLKEALRLQPSAPLTGMAPKDKVNGAMLPGGYHVPGNAKITIQLHEVHRDPSVWGDDVEAYRPERMLDENFGKLPADSWKPFGNGARACIGRALAMQEATLALALILHRYDLALADPTYDLHLKHTLTIKPSELHLVVKHRRGVKNLLHELLQTSGLRSHSETTAAAAVPGGKGAEQRITFLYGSNSGSCEGLARELASEGAQRGYETSVGELDAIAADGHLPTDSAVVICTASYEGKPTDNAKRFVDSITAMASSSSDSGDKSAEPLEGVRYTVFGAGHSDWAKTFNKIPKLVDETLEKLGAERLMPLSLADAAGDVLGDFENFKTAVWQHFASGAASTTEADVSGSAQQTATTTSDKAGAAAGPRKLRTTVLPSTANPAAARLGEGVDTLGTVVDHVELVPSSDLGHGKHFITIELAEGQTYRAGDYLAILPKNSKQVVHRALDLFKLQPDSAVVLNDASSFLPTDAPVRADELLASFVELAQPVGKRTLNELVALADQKGTEGAKKAKAKVQTLLDDYHKGIIEKRVSLLDLLESTPELGCDDLGFFLEQLPKMKIRQYSISSSPLAEESKVTLTFDVVKGQAFSAHDLSDDEQEDDGSKSKKRPHLFFGVASNYLASLKKGDQLNCAVRASVGDFHLPTDASLPVVMYAAGTGIAPFRGFVQERAMQRQRGREVGKTMLFYGCRNERDMLHADEMRQWAQDGLLDFRPVFSRPSGATTATDKGFKLRADCKHVQDRVWQERDEVREQFRAGAYFYTCGSGAKMAASLKATLIEMIQESKGCEKAAAEEFMERLSKERYRTDVFL